MRSLLRVFLIAFTALAPAITVAEVAPRVGPYDRRVRYIAYNKDDVTMIDASYGASTMILFQEDEKIETLAAGDAIAWKVEPNRKGNVLFIKPIEKNATANLNVLTNKRAYVFLLRAEFRNVTNQTFKIVFRYPDDEADARLMTEARERAAHPNRKAVNVANANTAYAYKGSSVNKPLVVFDDGVKTWFRFAGNAPAIFAVDAKRNESLINYQKEGDYIVVNRVNYQWTLRTGNEITCIFNQRLNDLNEPTGLEPFAPHRVNEPPLRSVVQPRGGKIAGTQ